MLACVLAAHHPERVKAAILVGTGGEHRARQYPYMTTAAFPRQAGAVRGLGQVQPRTLARGLSRLRRALRRNICSEPHSTKQIEDGIDWAADTTGAVLAKTVEARLIPPSFDVSEAMYRKIRCPVLMIHGDDDQIQPYARAKAVAELTGAELVTIPGGGHNPLGRFPAKCNALIIDFLDRRLGIAAPARRIAPRGTESQEGALSLLADRPRARAPRHRHHAGVAQTASRPRGRLAGAGPVTRLLEASGERVHPLSARLASEFAAYRAGIRASTICIASRPSAAWTRC